MQLNQMCENDRKSVNKFHIACNALKIVPLKPFRTHQKDELHQTVHTSWLFAAIQNERLSHLP